MVDVTKVLVSRSWKRNREWNWRCNHV